MRTSLVVAGLVLTVLIASSCSDLESSFDGDRRIPENATVVAHGEGTMSFTAEERGIAYVLNRRTKDQVYSVTLDRTDEIVVRPDRNRIEVNGRTVDRGGLDEDLAYEIQWSPFGDGDSGNGSATLPASLANAQRVTAGRGDLTHRFDHPGRIWVWDATSGAIVCGHKVHKDALVKVQPDRSRVLLDGSELSTRTRMREGNTYHVYYERD